MGINNIYRTNKIYSNHYLQSLFETMEDKFNITHQEEKFSTLVNFSQNADSNYHQWFIYREGFAGKLIDHLLSLSSSNSNEIILDPFCGSGTTLVSAVMNGYNALGIDINPMSIAITKVKTSKYSESVLDEVKQRISRLKDDSIDFNQEVEMDFYSKYFQPRLYCQLKNLSSYIDSIENNEVRDIFHAAFLCIIADVSDRKRDGNGLKISISKVANAINFFIKKIENILRDMNVALPKITGSSLSFQGSAADLDIFSREAMSKMNSPIGAIMFSPPYANSFDYFESYKLELALGNYLTGSTTIKSLRNDAVYSFVGGNNAKIGKSSEIINLLAEEIEKSIPEKEARTGKIDSRTRKVPNMIKGYFRDMFEVIDKCYEILGKGKQVYIVVDQSSYLGKIVPSDLLFADYADKIGFIVKEIIVCRPSKTSGQQYKLYPFLKESLRESIVILEKK